MQDLIIVGAGGFGRELLQWIKDINRVEPKWNILGFIDDNLNSLDNLSCDSKVIGTIEDCQPKDGQCFVMGIANPSLKESITRELKTKGAHFVSIIHPTAIVADNAKIGEGIVMYPNSILSVNTVVGDFVTVLSSGIGHDAVIGDYCTISSFCDITGGVRLGNRVFLGSHCTIIPKRRIGDDAYISAGSVVVSNVKSGVQVFGNPARKMDL